ncbi:nitrile hydratase subunit beta [Sneathiella chinensis]|uniref:Nitrile hydratase subunit beta n=1 Tax=Sneathiella chinensis TaxID=349750 RepID=A0ABQ5TZX1_9PROT|nr:nitrile hydratase subunit beta [Sneathiella chinensis]GLQ04981.1 nitrile hydratase [Sneathiella chinensis]
MDGVHDMGGMHGMGPVDIEENEPVFHAEWEKRMFALNNAVSALGIRNIDESRHARERMTPAAYLASSYYEIWLDGLVRILTEKGVISDRELAGEIAPLPVTVPHNPPLAAADVDAMMDKGGTYRRETGKEARFKVGDRVRGRNIHPAGHTRLPRYARDKVGEIVADYGLHVFADSQAHGAEKPQHLYNVRFTSRMLWGEDGNDHDAIYVDLWDDHLEPAP